MVGGEQTIEVGAGGNENANFLQVCSVVRGAV
jgi:hypothetical protein